MTATATAPNQPVTANMISVVSNTFFISSYLHLYYMKYTYQIQPKSKKSLLAIASDSI
jgi:hypothetical protein